jgi:hypothetical protein
MTRTPQQSTHHRSIIVATVFAALLLALIILGGNAARAGTSIKPDFTGGVIDSDTTWTQSITVTSPITVSTAATLTIAPGVEVRFYPNTWLRIEGQLNAQGTHAQQIRMIGAPIGSAVQPWRGVIAVQPSANVRLQSVTIANAVAGLAIEQTSVTLASGAIVPAAPAARIDVLDSLLDSNGIGIAVDYTGVTTATTLTLRNTLFIRNGTGLQVLGLSNKNKLKLNHNSFIGNTIGLRASGQARLKALQQWWGSVAGPRAGDPTTCGVGLAPGTGDIVCGSVDFTPWSTKPTGRLILAAGAGDVVESALGLAAASDDDTLPTSTATLTVPTGTFVQAVDLLVSGRTSGELPGVMPGQPTQLGLEITAIAGGQEIHHFADDRSLILTIEYTLADLGGADPSKLKVLYWDEARQLWSMAGISTTLDPARQRLAVRIEHLSRFHVSSLELWNGVYLPLIRR